ncbi:TAFII55 protein conserved region-domain-containing protein [Cercophora newfieldiana]|uniref:TAFII55 protein conserved region-domain-containing protein n=1 Tax=Cercophora newfieldiana TaxID=92897 RepID=A0AA39YPX4_9PEZI|nr:TAFII55 protein conserved region-domain-containing protein [Cercophora newfieldiana]
MDQQQTPAPQKRLTLKITGSTASVTASTAQATPGGTMPMTMSPSLLTPSSAPKIKLISRKSQPPTPADGVPPSLSVLPSLNPASATPTVTATVPKITKTKAGRQPKPSAKKRTQGESDGEDAPLASGANSQPKPKKQKITLKPGAKAGTPGRLPALKIKNVKNPGRIPTRPLGEGYDSEAEDREIDPVIEEQFLLRMMPGEHCDYLRQAIVEKKIGIPKEQGGADVSMKFLDEEGRRAVMKIQKQHYAAILLDLPTITEGMKTWDKKAMVKSADICQMMLVFAKVSGEAEAKTVPLPKAVEHGHRWPHGITPPMHDARNRRFRKRLSKLEIQNKEAEVERLLAADKEAISSKAEFVDERQTLAPDQESGEEYEDEEEDAEGEAEDYFGDADVEMQDDMPFEVDDALLEAEFMDAVETPGDDLATPAVATEAITPATANTGTPAAQTEESGAEADGADEEESADEDEDEDGEDDEDDVEDDGDEDRHDEVAGVKIEIAALRKQLAQYEEQLAKSNMPMMRKRIEGNIKNIKSEIKLKQSAIGKIDED